MNLSTAIDTELTVDKIATAISERGLTSAALLMLELHRPLLSLAYNSAIIFEPLVAPLFGLEKVKAYREVLQSPENLNLLIARLEELNRATKKVAH